MLNFFMAGPEMVRWELTVESNGPFRLTVRHAQGVIVEYFNSSRFLRMLSTTASMMSRAGRRGALFCWVESESRSCTCDTLRL